MIKIETEQNKLLKFLQSTTMKYIIGTLLLSGIGISLPKIFHVIAGENAGAIFLPMHIAVLIATLTFGITSSIIVAGNSIIFSYLLTGMPKITRLPYMLIELIIYAVLLNLFNKKFNSYISLLATIVLGRILYSGLLFIAINVFDFNTYGISIIELIKVGLPGLIIQVACIPGIAKIINERLKLKND